MSDIAPIGRPAAAAYSQQTRAAQAAAPASVNGRASDRVELSHAAQRLSRLQEQPEVRQDLVERVRQQIADGTYETPEKLNAALDAMTGDLHADE